VALARHRQAARQRGLLNARVSGRQLRVVAGLSAAKQTRLASLAEAEQLSGRGTERLLRVARTIADLAEAEAVGVEHLEEAARFRLPASGLSLALAV
jgi:magnesium chelatase family protein